MTTKTHASDPQNERNGRNLTLELLATDTERVKARWIYEGNAIRLKISPLGDPAVPKPLVFGTLVLSPGTSPSPLRLDCGFIFGTPSKFTKLFHATT